MKRTAITLTLLIALCVAQAQNFNPIRSNRIPFFKQDEENFILGLQVDSVTTSGDSTFYHFHQTWDYQKAQGYGHGYSDDECVLPNGPSWLGYGAVELSDGRFLFTNYLKDTITLKPYEEVGETWSAFTFLNGDILWAMVNSIYTEEILGIESLLKEISFLRKDQEGELHPNFPTHLKVIISDSLGLVTTFPLRNLVEFQSNVWPEEGLWGNYELDLTNFSIIGLTNPNVGQNLITNISIYNFDVDDEFHWVEESVDGSGDPTWISKTTHRISKLIDKNYNESEMKIVYTWDNVQLYSAYGNQNGEPFNEREYKEYESTTSLNTADTIYYLPEKAYYNEWEGLHYRQHIHSYDRMRTAPIGQPLIGNYYEGCWEVILHAGDDGDEGFGEGLGDLGYYYESHYDFSWMRAKYLVYYKKGEQTWGTPLVINSVNSIHVGTVNVYPNPVHSGEYITISAPSDSEFYSVTLINMSGITLKHEKGLQGQQLWQIPSQLPAGIYILRVSNSSGEIFTTRLAIH